MKRILLGNLAADANTNIDLRGKIPAPIYKIVGAVRLAGRSVDEGGSATYDIASSVTATKVDEWTIKLGAPITTKDLLELAYIATTEYPVA